jgi:tRNA(fMet)-specific endonuclease VapC
VTVRYLLDTNSVSSMINDPVGPVQARLASRFPDMAVINPIISGEILFGIYKRQSARLTRQAEQIIASLEIVPIEAPTGHYYGQLRADLERKGTPIGANDLWIAAHALALDLTLVTANVSEFERVDGLRVENWLR